MSRTDKARVVAELRAIDGDACFYCGDPMSFRGQDKVPNGRRRATIEHLIDRSRGGTVHFGNSVLAHDRCNCARSPLKTVAEKIATRTTRAPPIPRRCQHVVENEEAALRQMLRHRMANGVVPRSLAAACRDLVGA